MHSWSCETFLRHFPHYGEKEEEDDDDEGRTEEENQPEELDSISYPAAQTIARIT